MAGCEGEGVAVSATRDTAVDVLPQQGFYPRRVVLAFPVGWAGRATDAPCVLQHDLHYVDASGHRHTAPRGTRTDGASIPRVFWRLAGHPFRGVVLPAAVLHDHYCVTAHELKKAGQLIAARALRWEADALFREGCRWLGAGRVMAAAYYAGVRCGAAASGLW